MAEWADRGFVFSGYGWWVKGSNREVGPGPNIFSDSEDNVWLDAAGHLHLKITRVGDSWQCAEVVSEDSFGYGRYEFHLAPGAEQLDPNVVLGLFTWDLDSAENNREIDIEFARWGDPELENAQYVVQPYDDPSKLCRFEFDSEGTDSTHWFDWRPEGIAFGSERGDPEAVFEPTEVMQEWAYDGAGLPTPGEAKARINLWLMGGQPPTDGQEVEVVIRRVEVIPAG